MEFSNKYHEAQFPSRYATKHGESLSRRLNNRREQQLLRRCLNLTERTERTEKDIAAQATLRSIADVGCGPGRFWGTLERTSAEALFALDISQPMLSHARSRHPEIEARFRLAAGSITALPFADDAFDCVVAMRLLHHFGEPAERRQALAELARIARCYVVISLWTDGNFKAWRRRRLEARRTHRSYQNRQVVARPTLSADFAAVGLHELGHFDLIPGYSQWRYYVLASAPTGHSLEGA